MATTRKRVQEHYHEALEYFPEDRIVCLALQGSQNYQLNTEFSDVDTKLIIVPIFEEIAMNKQPLSTTHVRENDEHIDFKDIRLYINTFRKQNINFLEILFTQYKIINPLYASEWNRLVEAREDIAHYNPYRAVKALKGMAMEKYHALKHPYPSKLEVLAEYGYDPKQLHHLLRLEEFLDRYISGESYTNCLIPTHIDFLKAVKLGLYNLEDAEKQADRAINNITAVADRFTDKIENIGDPKVDMLLDDVQVNIMKIAIRNDIEK